MKVGQQVFIRSGLNSSNGLYNEAFLSRIDISKSYIIGDRGYFQNKIVYLLENLSPISIRKPLRMSSYWFFEQDLIEQCFIND